MTISSRSTMRWSSLAGAGLLAVLLRPALARAVDVQAPAPAVDGVPREVDDGRGTPLAVLLERAGSYVTRYGESFHNLVAEEAYRQVEYSGLDDLAPRRVRNLRSDVVFARLAGSLPWATFRDVYDVDGSEVHDRNRRLERLFTSPSADGEGQARAILEESSRYNLGRNDLRRNVNAPTIALLFLLPENQARFSFERKGRKTLAGFRTVEITFEERTHPTLVRDRWHEDVPASGSFWIDPTRGTILRTRIEYDLEKQKRIYDRDLWANAVVVTEYRREPGLDIFVPDTMTEWYQARSIRLLDGRASYANYRRFQVTSEWEVADAPQPPDATLSLLDKAGDYVLRYERALREVVAEELYEETGLQGDGVRAAVRSEVVFTLLTRNGEQGLSRSARSVPTLALAYLHPNNRDASKFERKGRTTPDGGDVIEVAFVEVARPTLNRHSDGTDAPVRGSFWIRERDGAVLRSRTETPVDVSQLRRATRTASPPAGPGSQQAFTLMTLVGDGTGEKDVAALRAWAVLPPDAPKSQPPASARALVAGSGSMSATATYREDPALGLLVPVEMDEVISWSVSQSGRGTASAPDPQPVVESIQGKARYSGFHRLAQAPTKTEPMAQP